MKRVVLVVAALAAACGGPPGPHRLGPPAPPPRGTVQVVAGETSRGSFDGVGKDARFNGPAGLAVAGDRALVADTFSGSLRAVELDTQATTTLIASPDAAEPRGVTAHDDVIYFGDGACVRTFDGQATALLAGDCSSSAYADGAAADARFSFLLHDLEVDAERGVLYAADRLNDAIRVVDLATGETTTLVGGDGTGSADGTGSDAHFDGPGGLALAGDTLYVADTFNHTIRAVDVVTRAVTTPVGAAGSAGLNDGPFATARLSAPQGVALVGTTRLVAGGFDGRVRVVDLDAQTVETLAPRLADRAYALGGTFAAPVAAPGGGAVLWMDLNGPLVQVALDGAVTHVAGPVAPLGFIDGPGRDARFVLPSAVEIDDAVAYIADLENHAVRAVDLVTFDVRTLVGGPDREGSADGPFADARLVYPAGLALDRAARVLYVADAGNQKIRALDLAHQTVATVAGDGTRGGDDGAVAAATFAEPWELVLDGGALFVADSGGATVRKIDLAAGQVRTLAGRFGEADHVDGAGADARFRLPVGVTIANGLLWVADFESHTLRTVDPQTGETATVVGSDGLEAAVEGPADFALLAFPGGLTASADGATVYVAESGGNVVRAVDTSTLSSSFVVGQPTSSGGLPTGVEVPLAGATLLEPQDVAVWPHDGDDDLVILSDGAVWVARP